MKAILLLVAVFLFGPTDDADAQWIKSKGSLSQSVTSFAYFGSNLLAGTDDQDVYLSTDNGTSWSALGNSVWTTPINAIVVSGTNLIVGTEQGVFISTNNGIEWQKGNSGLTYINAFAISGTNLFAGTAFGVYRSTDNGMNWTQTSLKRSSIFPLVFSLVVSGKNLYAAGGEGVFVSIDNGTVWNAIKTGLTNPYVYVLTGSGTNLFAGTDSGVFHSTNHGQNWDRIGLSEYRIASLVDIDTILFVGTESNGLFLSSNNGKTWNSCDSDLKSTYVGALAVSGTRVFAGTSKGLLLSSNNGATWDRSNLIPLNSKVFAIEASGESLFAGTYSTTRIAEGGIFRTTDHGTNWYQTALTKVNIFSLIHTGQSLLAGTDSGIFLSDDNASNWTRAGLTGRRVNYLAVSDRKFFACTDSGMFVSTDNGVSWAQNGLQGVQVNTFAILDTTLCAGTDQGIFISIDNGKSWVQTGLSSTTITCLAALGANLFAGTPYGTGGIHLSTDTGKSWKTVNAGLPNNTNVYVISLGVSGSNLFIGTVSYGVFLSRDTGRSWASMGLVTDIHCLAILGEDLYAGTYGSSVWKRPLSEMIPSGVKSPTDGHLTRVQSIPNPFDARTNITFNLERSAFVSLRIFDVLGREVSVLVSEELSAGTYTRDWNASTFPPGEYFYRFEAGAYSQSNKLMLAK